MKEVIESTNLEKQLTRHHEGDSDYTHQGTGSPKKVLIASGLSDLGIRRDRSHRRFSFELFGAAL